jgi:TonB family protein
LQGTLLRINLCLCLLGAQPALAAPSPSSDSDQAVRFNIIDDSAKGILLPGNRLALSVELTGMLAARKDAQNDNWVVIVEADSFPTRLIPMTYEADLKLFSAKIFFEPYAAGFLDARRKAIRIDVIFARRRGMRLEYLLRRMLYVTVGLLAPSEQKLAAAGLPSAEEERVVPPGVAHPDHETVTEEAIREEDLLPTPPVIQSRAYWKTVNDRISRSWKQAVRQQGKSSTRRSPRVQFRLFASGEAQLVQVERSSGDRRLDDVGLQAVIDAHPFPPLPAALSDPHIDVHVDLPGPRR